MQLSFQGIALNLCTTLLCPKPHQTWSVVASLSSLIYVITLADYSNLIKKEVTVTSKLLLSYLLPSEVWPENQTD